MDTVHETTTGPLHTAQGIGEGKGGPEGEPRSARNGPSVVALVVSVSALWLLHLAVWTTGAVVGLAVVFAVPPFHDRPPAGGGGALREEPDGAETRTEAPLPPDGAEGGDGAGRPAPVPDDDVWRLDGFADFGDARMTVSGDPGAGWSESRLSGRVVWVDGRCRLSSAIVEFDDTGSGGTDSGGTDSGGTDAGVSERLARSIGKAALGDVPTRSDPAPATISLPLAHGGRAVELASVTLLPSEPQPDDASFLVVSARASVEHGRAVVFALACIDTPVARADVLARDLVTRFHLETSP